MTRTVEPHVLTLVAAEAGALDARLAAAIADSLPQGQRPNWLAPEIACDIPYGATNNAHDPEAVDKAVRAMLGNRPVDMALQPATDRRKALLIADMDSTIVVGETLDELAAHAGLKDRVAAITERAMRGELDFEAALRQRVAMLAGLREEALARTYARLEPMPGAAALVATMKANGARTALVSGGFTYFTARVSHLLGFDFDSANQLEIAAGRLTGGVIAPIRGRDAKRATLFSLCDRLSLAPTSVLAVGDGANDLDMIAAAGMGVAFHAKPAVRAAARFTVDHGDLTSLLYFQGYRLDDIAQAQKKGAP